MLYCMRIQRIGNCQNGARRSGAVRCRGDSATGAGDGQLPPASSGAGAGLPRRIGVLVGAKEPC